jgi:hypothetical protein
MRVDFPSRGSQQTAQKIYGLVTELKSDTSLRDCIVRGSLGEANATRVPFIGATLDGVNFSFALRFPTHARIGEVAHPVS